MPYSWKQTFVTLIFKHHDASQLGYYRPISLCNILYKIYAKLLVIRMKPILPCLISPEQGAFIEGRSIFDNILITQEFMHDLCQALIHRSLMAIKLNMEWVYDRMHWGFLEGAILNFGFHPWWTSWVLACIERPSFAILINGTPTDFFSSTLVSGKVVLYPCTYLLFMLMLCLKLCGLLCEGGGLILISLLLEPS